MNCETPDFTDRTNKTMTTHPPLVAHNDEARHEEISSHVQANLLEKLRLLDEQTRHGLTERRQAHVANYPIWWEIWLNRINLIRGISRIGVGICLIGLWSGEMLGATIYLEPGERKIIPATPVFNSSNTTVVTRKGMYVRTGFCVDTTTIKGFSTKCTPSWSSSNTPTYKSPDNRVSAVVKHNKIEMFHPATPMSFDWVATGAGSSTGWTNSIGGTLNPGWTGPIPQWGFSGGANALGNMPLKGVANAQTTNNTANFQFLPGTITFTGTTVTFDASAAAIPGTSYNVPSQKFSSITALYEVWPATTVIISHPCTVGVPAVQNIPFGNVFVSGVPIGTESTTVIQNKISCAGAVANRKYTITSTGTATGATSIPLKETGGGGTTQGNIYIKTATGGGCSTTGARTMGTAYTLPVISGNTYGQNLYATLCNVANGAAGKGSATATITYDWN